MMNSAKISLFLLEFINSLIFLPPSSSHFQKFIYCLERCLFSTCPSQTLHIYCVPFVLSSSLPPEQKTERTAQGLRCVLGLFSQKNKLKNCRYTAADPHEHHFLTHAMPTAPTAAIRAAGQMLQSSHTGLGTVWLWSPNAVRDLKT